MRTQRQRKAAVYKLCFLTLFLIVLLHVHGEGGRVTNSNFFVYVFNEWYHIRKSNTEVYTLTRLRNYSFLEQLRQYLDYKIVNKVYGKQLKQLNFHG